MGLQPWYQKTLAPWKKSYDQPRQYIKKKSHYFTNKDPSSQSYGFSSSHVWMWELDHKENLVLKNWCFWTVVLEETLESPLDCKEIKPVGPKGNSFQYPTFCNPMNRSMPGLPVHHQLPEFTQTHVHWVGDTIQRSHPLSSPFPPALNLSQHQGLFRQLFSWVGQRIRALQLQPQSFRWIFRADFL